MLLILLTPEFTPAPHTTKPWRSQLAGGQTYTLSGVICRKGVHSRPERLLRGNWRTLNVNVKWKSPVGRRNRKIFLFIMGCLSIGFEVLDLLLNLISGVSFKSENNNRNQYQTASHLERCNFYLVASCVSDVSL